MSQRTFREVAISVAFLVSAVMFARNAYENGLEQGWRNGVEFERKLHAQEQAIIDKAIADAVADVKKKYSVRSKSN